MQLKALGSFKAEETVQLRMPVQRTAGTENEKPEASGTAETAEEPASSETASTERIRGGEKTGRSPRSRNRNPRKAPRPSLRSRLAADPRLAPLLSFLDAAAARLAPYARRMKPEYPRPGRTGWRRWLPSWRQWLGGTFAGIGLSGLFLVVAYAATDIPDDLNSHATQQDNVYFWSDGTPMARTGWVQRQAMPLRDIPEDVRWAVLAAENENFYNDPGISPMGITRAVLRTFGQGDTQGGSTITQQYVKNAYLNQDQTVRRKFTEAMIALKLDNRMSKEEILESYLNTSWFGRGTYGIQRAAQAYYGKDVSELNASEAAFLASLLKGAGLYDPALSGANRDRAEERWSWTLDRMVDIGKLSPAERARYKKFPEPLKSNPLYSTGEQSDYLVELASQYAKKSGKISEKQFDLGGYQIYTTFDKERERRLTDVVTKARKKALKDDPKTAKTVHYGAASVAADGRILAVYGGPDHRKQGYNESNATTVPAGTAFTPFVYAAGLQHGVRTTRDGERTPVTGESLYNGDHDVPVTTPEGPYWDRSGRKVAAGNDGEKSYGQISLRRAMALSVNTPFMQLGMDTGLDKVRATAVALGLLPSSIGARVPALSMGSSTPSAIRMAGGYSTFAAAGEHTEPYSVHRITRNGAKIPLDLPEPRRAVRAEVAEEVSSALTESFRTAHPDGAPATAKVAGKPGTTEKDTAAWYVGTHESVSTAVVVYRIDLTESLEPLPLEGLAGTADDSVPYGIWSGALGLSG
ncbi:penicillin-binding protein [Streptomyces sp. M2CJ-2]|uniref:transglycosylase domain-containing protein n=1 Tax=Streptomyces sp. M2CJ-2 TaxID=2803948 RepID=UPI001926B607|nr:transglycosylase domain-containing protein [Streptomyces sp. M2CJ-2]MBL3666717.1 penicillin-binding protein [Streptomyces sp. M2CJ-2]